MPFLNPFNYTEGTSTPQKNYPVGAGVTLTAPAAPTPTTGQWANGAYVEIHASTPTAWILTGVEVDASTGASTNYEIDIAVGGAGSESVIATISLYYGGAGPFFLPIPIDNIPQGSRVSARARSNGWFLPTTVTVSVLYYESPVTGRVTTTTSPLLVAPSKHGNSNASGIYVSSGSSAWANGSYVTVVSSTAGPIILGSLEVVGQPDAHNGTQELELDVAVGSAGNETVVTTVRLNTKVLFNAALCQVVLRPILDNIPAASRVSVRLRSSQTYLVTVSVKLHYYLNVAEDVSDLTTAQVQKFFPPAADALALTSNASSGGNGAWVEYSSSLPTQIAITQIVLARSQTTEEAEIDIGVGALGAEQVVGTVRWATDGDVHPAIYNRLILLLGLRIAAGSRVCLRVRVYQATAKTYNAAIGYIATPTFLQLADEPQKRYIVGAVGANISVGSGGYVNSAWSQVVAAVESDIYVTGISPHYSSAGIGVVEVGAGNSGAEQVVGTLRYVDNLTGMFWFPLPTMAFVPSGTRLAVRSRRSVAGSLRVGVTYYGVLPADTTVEPPPDELPPPYTFPTCADWPSQSVIQGSNGLADVASPWDDCPYEE